MESSRFVEARKNFIEKFDTRITSEISYRLAKLDIKIPGYEHVVPSKVHVEDDEYRLHYYFEERCCPKSDIYYLEKPIKTISITINNPHLIKSDCRGLNKLAVYNDCIDEICNKPYITNVISINFNYPKSYHPGHRKRPTSTRGRRNVPKITLTIDVLSFLSENQ